MGIYLDSANMEEIVKVKDYPFVEGISCNPTLIAKALNKNEISPQEFLDHVIKLSHATSGNIFVQTNYYETSEIIQEARKIQFILEERAVIKLPYTKEGLKAIRILKGEHIKTAVTAIFTPIQAYISAYIGAAFVAPYCSRITNSGADGIKAVGDMLDIYGKFNFNTKLLVASVKNKVEIEELLKLGAHHIALPLNLIDDIVQNDQTSQALLKFKEDLRVI